MAATGGFEDIDKPGPINVSGWIDRNADTDNVVAVGACAFSSSTSALAFYGLFAPTGLLVYPLAVIGGLFCVQATTDYARGRRRRAQRFYLVSFLSSAMAMSTAAVYLDMETSHKQDVASYEARLDKERDAVREIAQADFDAVLAELQADVDRARTAQEQASAAADDAQRALSDLNAPVFAGGSDQLAALEARLRIIDAQIACETSGPVGCAGENGRIIERASSIGVGPATERLSAVRAPIAAEASQLRAAASLAQESHTAAVQAHVAREEAALTAIEAAGARERSAREAVMAAEALVASHRATGVVFDEPFLAPPVKPTYSAAFFENIDRLVGVSDYKMTGRDWLVTAFLFFVAWLIDSLTTRLGPRGRRPDPVVEAREWSWRGLKHWIPESIPLVWGKKITLLPDPENVPEGWVKVIAGDHERLTAELDKQVADQLKEKEAELRAALDVEYRTLEAELTEMHFSGGVISRVSDVTVRYLRRIFDREPDIANRALDDVRLVAPKFAGIVEQLKDPNRASEVDRNGRNTTNAVSRFLEFYQDRRREDQFDAAAAPEAKKARPGATNNRANNPFGLIVPDLNSGARADG